VRKYLAYAATFTLVAHVAAAGTIAPVGDRLTCSQAIDAIEHVEKHPAQLVQTIALVESGRLDPVDKQIRPWPWTINAAGIGHFYPTKAEAMAAVTAYRASGIQSIDVGCMQINLQQHPAAFGSLDDAFDPAINVAYGTRFLDTLYRRTGDWPKAIAGYHSLTPAIGALYWNHVQSSWALGSRYSSMPLSQVASTVEKTPVDPNMTPEFAQRMREMAEDHRRNLMAAGAPAPPGPGSTTLSARRLRSGRQQMADGAPTRSAGLTTPIIALMSR
jgi:hypothetical protein